MSKPLYAAMATDVDEENLVVSTTLTVTCSTENYSLAANKAILKLLADVDEKIQHIIRHGADAPLPCRYGDRCTNRSCRYLHLRGTGLPNLSYRRWLDATHA